MSALKEFVIPFIGLKDGSHEFGLEVTDTFFEAFPGSELEKGSVKVRAEMLKRPQMLTFDVFLDGDVSLPCDRCGNNYRQPVNGSFQLIVNLNGETFNDEDDLISLPPGAHEFDLSQYVYEYLTLLLPSRKVCGETPDPSRGDCDPVILEKLKELEPGHSEEETGEDENSDPRWDGLKNIKFDN